MSKEEKQIPFLNFSTDGPVIHFAHANGYPPEAYRQFLAPFQKDYQVIASKFRPLWGNQNPDSLKRWHQFADDMIAFLDQRQLKNIIGMGHSLGGVSTLLAAMKRPDLFSKLILLDPVIFDGFGFWLASLFPVSIKKKFIPIAKIALKRRDQWSSREEVYELWRSKRVFQRLSDTVLEDFITHAIVPDGKGKMTLAYSKAWEAQVYTTVPFIFKKVKNLKTPVIVVKGEHTDVITSQVWKGWQQAQPNNHFINFKNAGHLIPLEHPTALAHEILATLALKTYS